MSAASSPPDAPGTPRGATLSPRPRGRASEPLAWRPPDDLDQASWMAVGKRLGSLSRTTNWWLGDWLRYGTEKWGAKYRTASKITGYDRHSLENMVYVASRFELSLRRENLSWSHHALVAGLDPAAQAHWLDMAAERRLSVSELRLEIRAVQRASGASDDEEQSSDLAGSEQPAEPQSMSPSVVFCPQCGCQIPPPTDVTGEGEVDN
jgi:hypothetical protein